MKAQPRPTQPLITPPRPGFTLVEILVVIVIISILMAVAIPAITIAITRGKNVAMKAEVNSLVDAVKQYEQKYGDYPPDFSDWTVVQRTTTRSSHASRQSRCCVCKFCWMSTRPMIRRSTPIWPVCRHARRRKT